MQFQYDWCWRKPQEHCGLSILCFNLGEVHLVSMPILNLGLFDQVPFYQYLWLHVIAQLHDRALLLYLMFSVALGFKEQLACQGKRLG